MKRQVQITVVLLTMLMTTIAWAVDLDMVLAPPRAPARGGETVILTLYLHNNTDATITRELPPSLPCRVEAGQTPVSIDAELLDPEAGSRVEIPGRGFAKRRYAVTLPIYAMGPVQMAMETLDTNPLTIQVKKAPSGAWVGEQLPLAEGPSMVQSFLSNFSVHEPMYFLFGVDPGLDQSKFQFSFSYRLFNPEGYLAEKAPWLSGFHLGYTQRSIWDLKDDSKPFDDTSYMPEIFYMLPKIDLNIDRISAFGIISGFQHRSNGKGGEESRSTNYVYIKPIMSVHLTGPYHFKIAPKIYTYVANDDDTNENLKDYRGYFDLELGIIDPEGFALKSHLWWAKEGASVQADMTYPLTRLMGKSLNFYLHAQYFSGYGETLAHYNERHDAFRLGLSIVR